MSNFQTKVDFSTQIKEYPNTDGTLSGSVNVQQYTILGTDYSDLPLGLDPTTTGISATYVYTTMGYFTGTTGSTTYYFTDPNMDIANPYLSTLNGTNSGLTQNVAAFSPTYSTTIDGNFFDVLYSGVSFDMTPVTFIEYTSGEFSGVTFTNVLNYLSGTTYPWWFLKSGSTTWGEVKGRLQTDRMTIIEGAFPGYVLTADNLNGDAIWQPISGLTWAVTACTSPLFVSNIVSCPSSADTLTIYTDTLALDGSFQFLLPFSGGNGTDSILVVDSNGYVKTIPQFSGGSGTCITDLYVTNIHGCSPIHIQPTSSDDVYLVEGGGNVGIGVTSATTKLHVSGSTIVNSDYMMLSNILTSIPSTPNLKGFLVDQDYNRFSGYISRNINVSGATGLYMFNDSSVLGQLYVGGSQILKTGITIVPSGFYQNKVILKGNPNSKGMVFNAAGSDPSATFWWEFDGSSGMILKGSGNNQIAYLGLSLNPDGSEMPTSNLQIGGTGTTGTFQYKDGNEQDFYVLMSDNDGNANWQPLDIVLSGGCLSDVCVKGILSLVKDLYVKGLTVGTGASDSGSTATTYVTNTAIGKDVLASNTTGTSNTGVGADVLSGNTTGASNTGVGTKALTTNSTGFDNVAVGYHALFSNVNGFSNTAVGVEALYSNSGFFGRYNTAIGRGSLYSNVNGFSNTAVGYGSLSYNTQGLNNTSIGVNSLYSNTIGNSNIGIGSTSLQNNVSGTSNVSIGLNSASTNIGGNNNVTIGVSSDVGSPFLTNAIAIGANSVVNTSNSMVLGDGSINVGIGTSSPTSTLHLEGLNGYSQLRLVTSYTPTSTADTNGSIGDTAWDDNFIYIKTTAGWKRTGLSTF